MIRAFCLKKCANYASDYGSIFRVKVGVMVLSSYAQVTAKPT